MSNVKIKYKFSGHETFVCRYAWLTKAATSVSDNPSILTTKREDDAMALLGVGKNMVRSIRYWAEAMGVIESTSEGHVVTDFGRELLLGQQSSDGKYQAPLDPYLEDIQTLWLLHWKLATNPVATVFAWDFLLNKFQEPELFTSTVIRAFEKELLQNSISQGSLEQMWDVFLHSYVPTRGRKGEVREDNLDCPLVELDLLIPTGIIESSLHPGRIESKFAFRREDKLEVSNELFAYCLCEFWNNTQPEDGSMPLHLIVNGHGSPGQVFKIPELDIRNRLLNIHNATASNLSFEESAAIPRVIRMNNNKTLSLQHAYNAEDLFCG